MRKRATSTIWRDLSEKRGIDAFWYPGIDIGLLPNGPLTEVDSLRQILTAANLDETPENVAELFLLKKSVFGYLGLHPELAAALVSNAEPRAGSELPVTFEMAQLVTYGILLLLAKGFLAELGKDAYAMLRNAFRKKIRDDEEVEVLVRATGDFVRDNRKLVVTIQANTMPKQKTRVRRSQRKP